MTPVVHPAPATALAPLRAELLRRARDDADRARHDAAATAAGLVGEATRRAEEIIAAAIDDGESEAARYRAMLLARVRGGIRMDRLAAQRAAYDELVRQVREAVCALRHEPGYEQLRQRLVDRAREVLGADAVITDLPDGGVVATRAGRRVDFSLAGFAERAVDRLGAEVSRLWTA